MHCSVRSPRTALECGTRFLPWLAALASVRNDNDGGAIGWRRGKVTNAKTHKTLMKKSKNLCVFAPLRLGVDSDVFRCHSDEQSEEESCALLCPEPTHCVGVRGKIPPSARCARLGSE